MKRILMYTSIYIFSILACCSSSSAASPEMVFVSILPQKFFMQQICKESVKIEVIREQTHIPTSLNPHK